MTSKDKRYAYGDIEQFLDHHEPDGCGEGEWETIESVQSFKWDQYLVLEESRSPEANLLFSQKYPAEHMLSGHGRDLVAPTIGRNGRNRVRGSLTSVSAPNLSHSDGPIMNPRSDAKPSFSPNLSQSVSPV